MLIAEQFRNDVLNYIKSNYVYFIDVCEKFQEFKYIDNYILVLELEGYITINEKSGEVKITEMGKDCIKVV